MQFVFFLNLQNKHTIPTFASAQDGKKEKCQNRNTMTVCNGFAHPYHFGDSTSCFRGSRSNSNFLSHFSIKIL